MGAAFGLPFFAWGVSVHASCTRKDPPGSHLDVTGGPFLVPGGIVEDRRN